MKTDNLNEETIVRMLQAHERRAAEQRLHGELADRYGHYRRQADLRHYALTGCLLVAFCGVLIAVTPVARAAATSPCTLEQRITAIDTSEQIIQAL